MEASINWRFQFPKNKRHYLSNSISNHSHLFIMCASVGPNAVLRKIWIHMQLWNSAVANGQRTNNNHLFGQKMGGNGNLNNLNSDYIAFLIKLYKTIDLMLIQLNLMKWFIIYMYFRGFHLFASTFFHYIYFFPSISLMARIFYGLVLFFFAFYLVFFWLNKFRLRLMVAACSLL